MKKIFEDEQTKVEVLPATGSITKVKTSAIAKIITDDQIESLGQHHGDKLAAFNEKILSQVRTSDMDDFGDNLNKLVTTAKGLDPSKFKTTGIVFKIKSIFSSVKDKMLAEYSSVESRMDQLVQEMKKNETIFSNRISDLDQMYESNKDAFLGLEEAEEEGKAMLAELEAYIAEKKNEQVDDSFVAQDLFKLQNQADRLAKRIDDINRSKLLSQQIAPQIGILKNNSLILSSKFKDVQATTIPAWKNAFTLYILNMEQQKGAQIINNIADATDAAFKIQADQMRIGVQEVAKANQRSVVSYDTLEHVQKQLLGAFDDMEKIATQARQLRQENKVKIEALEKELITKFLPRNDAKQLKQVRYLNY